MARNKTEKEWLSTGEVAKLCGVTLPTVRKWVDSGKLPASIFGGARKVRRVDADAFMDAARERVKKKMTTGRAGTGVTK